MADNEDQQVEGTEMMPRVITLLSSILQRVADSNDQIMELNELDDETHQKMTISIFHGLTRPTISIQTYLIRIFKYANCSPSCFVVAYVYLDRFVQKQPSFPINSFNIHRLLITSVLVSAKFMDDLNYNNAYYAKVGGISNTEMNLLEVDFLFGLGFQLNVNPNTFYTYCSYLQREVQLQSPPLQLDESHVNIGRYTKHLHSNCFNEDESTHHKQLAV